MQTDFRLFDFACNSPSTDGLKIAGKITGADQAAGDDSMVNFTEIMRALLHSPKAQLAQVSENQYKTDQLEIAATDLESDIAFDAETETEATEMIEMLWALNNTVERLPQDTAPGEQGDLFMDLARLLLDEGTQSLESSDQPDQGDFTEKWSQIMALLKGGAPQSESNTESLKEPLSEFIHEALPVQTSETVVEKAAVENKENGRQAPMAREIVQDVNSQKPAVENVAKVPSQRGDSVVSVDVPAEMTISGRPDKDPVKQAGNAKDGLVQALVKESQGAGSDHGRKMSRNAENIVREGKDVEISVKNTGQRVETDTPPRQTGNSGFFRQSPQQSDSPIRQENFENTVQTNNTTGESLRASSEPAEKTEIFKPLAAADGESNADKPMQRPSISLESHQDASASRSTGKSDTLFSASETARPSSPSGADTQSDVIRQIVQRMSMNHTMGGQSKMVIQLKPDFLGNVHMQVLTENQQVTVRMTADSQVVKEIVEQNIHFLKQELQSHGLEIQKFDVFVANDNQGAKSEQNMAGFGQTLRHRQQNGNGGKPGAKESSQLSATETRRQVVTKENGEIDYFA